MVIFHSYVTVYQRVYYMFPLHSMMKHIEIIEVNGPFIEVASGAVATAGGGPKQSTEGAKFLGNSWGMHWNLVINDD